MMEAQDLWDTMWGRLTSIEGTTDLTIIEIREDDVVYAPGNRAGWWTRKWYRDPFGKLWLWHEAEQHDD